jgi:hypothetical protein
MRTFVKIVVIVVFFIVVLCPLSFGEKFVMKSDERITGEIVSYDGKTFRVKSPMGILSIELGDVEKIEGNSVEGIVGIFTGAPSPQTPDRITGTIEYVQNGELRIKTEYGYVVVYTLNKVTGIDLKPQDISGTGAKATVNMTLRSEPAKLSKDDMERMIQEKNFSHPTERIIGIFKPEYEVKTINDIKVVIEHNTGLMWQQSGSSGGTLDWEGAKNYINLLNREQYAGFSDWRLPTVEELMSLMESTRKNGKLYIDLLFDAEQERCWSVDESSDVKEALYAQDVAVYVSFYSGIVKPFWGLGSNYHNFVRAVRSIQ